MRPNITFIIGLFQAIQCVVGCLASSLSHRDQCGIVLFVLATSLFEGLACLMMFWIFIFKDYFNTIQYIRQTIFMWTLFYIISSAFGGYILYLIHDTNGDCQDNIYLRILYFSNWSYSIFFCLMSLRVCINRRCSSPDQLFYQSLV